MKAEELKAFLDRRLDAVIGINRRAGGPQLSVVWSVWDGEQFLLSFPIGSAKHHNLKRDPNVTLLINDPAAMQYVVAYGRVELIEPIPHEHRQQLLRKYVPAAEIDAWVERAPDDEQVGVLLRPERMKF